MANQMVITVGENGKIGPDRIMVVWPRLVVKKKALHSHIGAAAGAVYPHRDCGARASGTFSRLIVVRYGTVMANKFGITFSITWPFETSSFSGNRRHPSTKQ
jgi:hypothetical protein